MLMRRCGLVSTVLVPLILGFFFLVFAISTEWWIRLDYSYMKKFDDLANVTDPATGIISLKGRSYKLKKVSLEFPKFTSLHGGCDEYRLIKILVPVPQTAAASASAAAPANIQHYVHKETEAPVVTSTVGSNFINETTEETKQQQQQQQQQNECLTLQECQNMTGDDEVGDCFSCQTEGHDTVCFFPPSRKCDGIVNCLDISDEVGCQRRNKSFYANEWHDARHKCWRHEYNLIEFAKFILRWDETAVGNLTNEIFSSSSVSAGEVPEESARRQIAPSTDASDESDDEEVTRERMLPSNLLELYMLNKSSIRQYLYRVTSLKCFIVCAVFTLLCIITMIFVSCCRNLNEKSASSASCREDGTENGLGSYGNGPCEEDDEALSIDASSSKRSCCLCNCLLCPFVFFAIFAIFAFLSCALGLGIYLYSLCHYRFSYLVYDSEYMPIYMTQAYQNNPWLFDIQRFGISFYSCLIAFCMYLLVLILSTCLLCRIQMSPAWRKRYTDTYEVLQMQDLVINSKKIYNQDKNSEKEEAKRRKKLEKLEKKAKKEKKEEETERLSNGANMNNNNDNTHMGIVIGNGTGVSCSEETQRLTSPKSRILAIDENYDD